MTRTLTFHGESDDLFEIEGTRGDEPDEIGCFARWATVSVARDEETGLFVTAKYGLGAGTWMIGISQLDEDMPLPDWPMRWVAPAGRGYSVQLQIDVPDGVTVSAVE